MSTPENPGTSMSVLHIQMKNPVRNQFMKSTREVGLWVVAAASLFTPQLALAQYGDGGGGGAAAVPAPSGQQAPLDTSASPLIDGGYVAILGSYQKSIDDPILKTGFGGSVFGGYRAGIYAIETGFSYAKDSDIDRISFSLRGLLFPLKSLPMAYAVVGAGASSFINYPVPLPPMPITGYKRFISADLSAGLGYMVPLHIGSYKFAIRAEALYRVGDRFVERYTDFIRDIPAPGTFRDYSVQIGLQLPLRIKHDAPVTPPAEAEVVPVAAPVDSDGDGVVDGVDQCPDSPAGSVVDATGCAPPPPAPVCKTPGPGEKISLAGCGTGDNIVLRGVNFETNKATLTVNAKTLLDDVAAELSEYPTIAVEVGGHTDARGSDAANQRLSERRAASVAQYLGGKGIAASRLTSVGYGEAQPIADNNGEAGWELNRRVALKILSGSGTKTVPAAAEAAPEAAAPEVEEAADVAPAAAP